MSGWQPSAALSRREDHRMIESKETYIYSEERQILIAEQLDLNGLLLLGRQTLGRAAAPLEDHIHPGAMEFVVVMKGEESYYVNNRCYPLQGGDVFVSFPGEPHRSGNPYQGVGEIIWFQIDPDVPGDFLGLGAELGEHLRCRLHGLHRLPKRVLHPGKEFLGLTRRCFEAFLMGREISYCALLLHYLLAALLWDGSAAPRREQDMERVIAYIHEHIAQEITMEQLCVEAGLSLSGFQHKFKQVTGRSPRDYVNHCKIERAQQMLREGRRVTDVASALGFNSSDYFSQVFRKYTNRTPSSFWE